MALSYPDLVFEESTVASKIFHKALAYCLAADNEGERHEVATVLQAHWSGLVISGKEFKLSDPRHFSRSALNSTNYTQGIGKLGAEWFIARAGKFIKAMATNAKLLYGDNEIDLLVKSTDGIWAFVECKSGKATSKGSQTNSYMQLCLESVESNRKEVWFVHCREELKDLASAYQWSCLQGIAINRARLPTRAQMFIDNCRENCSTNIDDIYSEAKCNAFINWYHTQVPFLNVPIDSERCRSICMNKILRQEFGISVHEIAVNKKDRAWVLIQLKRLISEIEIIDPTKPKSFWNQVYGELF